MTASDLLVFAPAEQARPAQQLAHGLRQQGYSVARDILSHDQAAAYASAKRMNFKYLAVVASEEENVELICLADGQARQISWQQACQHGLEL